MFWWTKTAHSNFGNRCFTADGPSLCNSLPAGLRQTDIGYEQCKRLLKTFVARLFGGVEIVAQCNYLFQLHFSSKMEEYSQQGLVKDGRHLGGSGGGSSKQIRMASKCGPKHPLGCGLNQGQGQALPEIFLLTYITYRQTIQITVIQLN